MACADVRRRSERCDCHFDSIREVPGKLLERVVSNSELKVSLE